MVVGWVGEGEEEGKGCVGGYGVVGKGKGERGVGGGVRRWKREE